MTRLNWFVINALVCLTAAVGSFAPSAPTASATVINAALGHQSDASQSSTYSSSYPASNATNGSLGDFTHAAVSPNQSWQVDLQATMTIDSVTLFNRADCCGGRLSDITVDILDHNGAVVSSSAVLNPGNGNPATLSFTPGSPVLGRTVRVSRSGSDGPDPDTLSLAEVQVFADNVALGASATQTSTLSALYVATNATNGSLGDFTHTLDSDTTPSLSVDLGERYKIDSIVLHNRDDCCADRLADITVEILDADLNTVFTSPVLNPGNTAFGGIGNGSDSGPSDLGVDLHELTGGPVYGNFVRVSRTISGLNGDQRILSLGEVQVFGSIFPVPEPSTFVLSLLGLTAMAFRRGRTRE
jgi:hypothetical protein